MAIDQRFLALLVTKLWMFMSRPFWQQKDFRLHVYIENCTVCCQKGIDINIHNSVTNKASPGIKK